MVMMAKFWRLRQNHQFVGYMGCLFDRLGNFNILLDFMVQFNTQLDIAGRMEDALTTSTYDLTIMTESVSSTLKFFEDHKRLARPSRPSEVELANVMAQVDESGDNYRKLMSKTVAFAERSCTSSKMIAKTLELLARAGDMEPLEVLECLDFYTELAEQRYEDAKEIHRSLEDIDKAIQNHMENFNNHSRQFLSSSEHLDEISSSLTAGASTIKPAGALALGVGAGVVVATGVGALLLCSGLFMYKLTLGVFQHGARGKYGVVYVRSLQLI
ncbi:hypothetical protein BC938DRAFT_479153 [Jimgerdemannia flammicorona]|uniref:Uncharacterized protein n=1 Tax=Jimgerdemannia flammicorona TaxID=994334 RepID=A0A433QLH9_9FUNG|nr:hypothetical protein BC938DRAFT_479153 [Jimgerdemannia flammicorona]